MEQRYLPVNITASIEDSAFTTACALFKMKWSSSIPSTDIPTILQHLPLARIFCNRSVLHIHREILLFFSGTYSTKGKLPACLANRTQQAIHAPNAHIRKCFYLSTEILEKDTGKDKLSLLTTNWWPPGQGLLKAVNYLSVLWVFKRASPKQGCSVLQVLWHSIRRTNRYSRRENLVWNSLALTLYPTGSFFFPLLFYWRC